MAVVVEASDALAARIPPGLALEDVRTVAEVIVRLNLSGQRGLIILVNHRLAGWDTELKAGDVVQIIPTIAGG